MTTREATSLLPRSAGADVMDDYARSPSERAAVIAFGAIQWPWLLRSLHGGKLADKHALLDRLKLVETLGMLRIGGLTALLRRLKIAARTAA